MFQYKEAILCQNFCFDVNKVKYSAQPAGPPNKRSSYSPAGEHNGELCDDVEDVDDDLVDGARLLVEDAAEERLVEVPDVRLVQRVHRVDLLGVPDLRLQQGFPF